MNRSVLLFLSLCSLSLFIAIGCGSGSTTPPPVISVAFAPGSPQALDANQSGSLTATVSNDFSNQGVHWTVICPAGIASCGNMAQAESASGVRNQYAAPTNVSVAEAVTITATSVTDVTKSASVHVTVNPALILANPPPPQPQPGIVGTAFSFNLANFVQGGTAPLTWAIKSGTLPAGLSLDAKTGMITGTPTAATTAAIVIVFTCADSGNPSTNPPANPQISLTINRPLPLTITSNPPPGGFVGKIYDLVCGLDSCSSGFHLRASGGISPYHWSWAPAPGSSLPPGLKLTTFGQCPFDLPHLPGIICGTPSAPGSYNVMVTVTDSASPLPATQTSPTYKILIDTLPPVINTTPAPSAGAVNLPYSFTFTASLGLAPFSWSETGALPPGLNFSTDGVLFGTPTATGSFPVSLDVTDSIGRAAPQQDFTLQIFQHGFKATGSMGTARYWHAATLLNSGKVLVTGGRDGSGNQLTTAELYDSTSGSFAPTGNMGTARLVNTVTLLNNGKVLVTGGLDVNGHALATAELFDPATGSFTPTGSLQTARGWHTATLLTNGKVLVTGGSDASDNPLATAELFDSTSGTFTVTGSMIIAHRSQSATLLNNGKVLVAGGTDNLGNALAEAELFDPASGTFSPTGNMQSARSLHEATLLSDGKVLVTGGLVDVGGQVLATAEAELFDPASGSFAPVGSMTNVRYLHTATLLNDGTVLVAGGVGDTTGSNPFAAAEVFDPTSGTFTPTGSMGTPRSQHTATLLNDGTVLVTGGGPPTLATAELYE